MALCDALVRRSIKWRTKADEPVVSCDGSGLNTSENSKDSHPLGLGVF